MNWLQKMGFPYTQQILEQVSQGIITPEAGAQQLQGADVCGMIGSMIDSYGNLELLSRILGCSAIMEQDQMSQMNQMDPMGQPVQENEEML